MISRHQSLTLFGCGVVNAEVQAVVSVEAVIMVSTSAHVAKVRPCVHSDFNLCKDDSMWAFVFFSTVTSSS
jgi:hypothetical protein